MNTDTSITFLSLGLNEPLMRALNQRGYTHPSPIQAGAIPTLLSGLDLIGCAQTGTGKTAAFALPILQRLGGRTARRTRGLPRALILAPTRELALQVEENFRFYGQFTNLRCAVIYGGVGQQPQVRALREGVDIVVATPGRLLDLFEQGHLSMSAVEIFVLDEADRMLDMGFAPDVKRVLKQLPGGQQSMLFSATMPEAIRRLAESFMKSPKRVDVAPVASTAEKVTQRVYHVEKDDKLRLLVHTLGEHASHQVLVFSRTKHGADKLVKKLSRDGIEAAAIHGGKSQGARQRVLEDFKQQRTRVLIATDIAARGIDVRGIDLVINFELPNEPESYVHRIGRTARAGSEGLAVSFCDATERDYLQSIEKLIRLTIPVHETHPFAVVPPVRGELRRSQPRSGGGRSPNQVSGGNRPSVQTASRPANRRGGSFGGGGRGRRHTTRSGW
ncbi:MAG: DEAD/DEAH box helicase [Opitutaceae bacterium]